MQNIIFFVVVKYIMIKLLREYREILSNEAIRKNNADSEISFDFKEMIGKDACSSGWGGCVRCNDLRGYKKKSAEKSDSF